MFRSKPSRIRELFGFLLLVSLLVLLVPDIALADEPAIDPGGVDVPEQAAVSYSAVDLEVGVHWMGDYGGNGDLPNSQSNGYGFYNTLRYHNWTLFGFPRWCQFNGHDCYIYGNSSAWEDDYVDNNSNYVDNVDVTYYQGHGWPGGITLNPPDDHNVQYGEVQGKWGDGDWEWGFFNTCSMMADSSRSSWYGTMNGMHGIASFRNTSYNTAGFGSKLATYLIFGYSFKDAWFKTCDAKQPSGVQAQIIVEDSAFWNENAYNQISDKNHDGTYWWWWKSCGAPTQATVTPNQLRGNFPYYQTPPLGLAEQETNFNNLSNNFGFGRGKSGEVWTADIDGTRIITDTQGRELEVDLDTGLFYYYDPARTYGNVPETAAAWGNALLSPTDAKDVADKFLRDNNLLPADASFNSVANVMLGTTSQVGAAGAESTSETVAAYEVIYSRYITTTVPTGRTGEAEVVQIPIDGAGAKMKVYVDPNASPTARVARAGVPGAVVGAQGGWRSVNQSARSAEADIALLDYNTQILPLFNNGELEPLVTYENVPFPNADSKKVTSYTVTGWEESTGESQDAIYPAYRLDAEYSQVMDLGSGITETVVHTGFTWIAANPAYMRPLARIEATSSTSQNYGQGSKVTATATDASRTLSDLGYTMAGSNLNFALGSGDKDSYVYNWYLGSVDQGKPIGSGRNLDYTLTGDDVAELKIVPGPLLITLQVVDSISSHTSINSNTASFSIQAVPPVFLPYLYN
ncbi:MAG: hypothetical protein KF753_13140 [Caldilineaceae bacterium]|nr:hypothetical protein [Caldilineaceae bacterium]